MVDAICLYLDDSGTRHPDHKPGRQASHGRDWFALGGYLIEQEKEGVLRDLHKAFCAKWQISTPLHSSEIRARSGSFRWLNERSPDEQARFYEELYQLMVLVPAVSIACVIDRPGYNARYREKYGNQRWELCKTAFSVVVERAAKHAAKRDRKLRVWAERSDKASDAKLKAYFDTMRANGMPFDAQNSTRYAPLGAEALSSVLYDFKTKYKMSPMAQLADLYLWPMAIGGYDPTNRPYARLKADGKLIDSVLRQQDLAAEGIKYSCFELVIRRPENEKTRSNPGSSQPSSDDLVG
jgi:Protein of unknown function (DUF3800)